MAKPRLVPIPQNLGALALAHEARCRIGRHRGKISNPSHSRSRSDAHRSSSSRGRRTQTFLRLSGASRPRSRGAARRGGAEVWGEPGDAAVAAEFSGNVRGHGYRVLP